MISVLIQARGTAVLTSITIALIIWWYWKYWATAKAMPVKLLRLTFLTFGTLSLYLLEKRVFRSIAGFSLGSDFFSITCILVVIFGGIVYGFYVVKSQSKIDS